MLSHAAWHRKVMAIKGRVGWAGGEQHEKKVALSQKLWLWSADYSDLEVAAKSGQALFSSLVVPAHIFCWFLP